MIRQFADVILASGSPRRRELFEREGITFTILKSDIEEETKETDPGKVVLDLSGQKALAVRDIFLKDRNRHDDKRRGGPYSSAEMSLRRNDNGGIFYGGHLAYHLLIGTYADIIKAPL